MLAPPRIRGCSRRFLETLSLILLGLCLPACETTEPPPGELIGGFRFIATLDASREEGRCLFPGAPQQLSFDGVLSYDPDDGRLWISTGSVRREGKLDTAQFQTRTPASAPGIPRQMSSCSCRFNMTEAVEGELLAARLCLRDGVPPPPVGPSPQACPEPLEDGKLSWSDCGCIRGLIREEVEFPAATSGELSTCTCQIDGVEEQAPASCEFVYQLEGILL